MRPPRRLLVLATVSLAIAASGCLEAAGFAAEALVCPASQTSALSGNYGLVLANEVPDEVATAMGERVRVTVTAQEGQILTASANWNAQSGTSRLDFDAPPGGIVQSETPGNYVWVGEVPAGDYTLEIEGDPMAFGVAASLALTVSGCVDEA